MLMQKVICLMLTLSISSSNTEVNDDVQDEESASGSNGQSDLVVKEEIKVVIFVIVKYSYTYPGRKENLRSNHIDM